MIASRLRVVERTARVQARVDGEELSDVIEARSRDQRCAENKECQSASLHRHWSVSDVAQPKRSHPLTLPATDDGRKLPAMVGAVIYIRVSTKEQTENLSLATQLKACEEYCERQGFDVLERFREEGESAPTARSCSASSSSVARTRAAFNLSSFST
jgi:Resolvase, N terminal domain